MTTATATPATTVRDIPLELLVVSDLNPRGKEAAIDEIQASLQEQKRVHYPLIVRQAKGGKLFEILDGSRRFRAAKALKWASLPCDVRNLNDEEALAFILTVQLQHRDLDPVEEAHTVDRLVKMKQTLPQIAKRVGKDVGYLTKIRVLINLEPAIEKEWREGHISLNAAMLIAREPKETQASVAEQIKNSGRWGDRLISDSTIANWCRSTHVDLSHAKWDLKDPKLHGGACTECPFRSGNNGTLFDDEKNKNTCLKPSCFSAKKADFIKTTLQEMEKKGKKLPLITSSYSSKTKGVIGSQNYDDHFSRENRKFAKEAFNIDTGEVQSVVFQKDYKPVKDEKALAVAAAREASRRKSLKKEETVKARAFRMQVADILYSKRKVSQKNLDAFLFGLTSTETLSDAERIICTALGMKAGKGRFGHKDYGIPVRRALKAGLINKQAYTLAVLSRYHFLRPGVHTGLLAKYFGAGKLATYLTKARKESKSTKSKVAKKVPTK